MLTARVKFPHALPLSLGQSEKHLAAHAGKVTSAVFLGNKSATFFRWSLRLAFSTVAPRREWSATFMSHQRDRASSAKEPTDLAGPFAMLRVKAGAPIRTERGCVEDHRGDISAFKRGRFLLYSLFRSSSCENNVEFQGRCRNSGSLPRSRHAAKPLYSPSSCPEQL
jgi:hypothetical protein